jgi:hypothetical protein
MELVSLDRDGAELLCLNIGIGPAAARLEHDDGRAEEEADGRREEALPSEGVVPGRAGYPDRRTCRYFPVTAPSGPRNRAT